MSVSTSTSVVTPGVALITGSTNGIGHALARRLLADGMTVIVHGPGAESVAAPAFR